MSTPAEDLAKKLQDDCDQAMQTWATERGMSVEALSQYVRPRIVAQVTPKLLGGLPDVAYSIEMDVFQEIPEN